MTTKPPRAATGLAHRGIRVLAIAVVALVVSAAGTVTGEQRDQVLLVVAVGLFGLAAWHWRDGGRRSSIGTSASVAGVLVGLLVVQDHLDDVDTFLLASGLVALAGAVLLRERRLAVTAFVAWAVLLGRPAADADTIGHCLLDPTLQVAIPRLDGPLLLAVAAIVVSTIVRWSGPDRFRSTARGAEGAGAIGLTVLLLAKAAELPGHRLLCGSGDALDEGWLVIGVAAGVVMLAYGLVTRDIVWSSAGVGSIALQGLLGTAMTAQSRWALGAAAILGGGMLVAERAGVHWPDAPGYAAARPSGAEVRRLLAATVTGEVPSDWQVDEGDLDENRP